MLLVHPNGQGSKATREELNISFTPCPDYSLIAKASAGGNLFAEKVDNVSKLEDVLKRAIESVKGGVTAVVDAIVVPKC